MTDAIRDRIATLANNFTAGITADRICDQFIIIDRAELPSVSDSTGGDPNTFYVDGTNVVFTSANNAREWCLRDIAVWQHIEHKQADYLDRRRDELALEFTADTRGTLSGACNYSGLLPWTRKMVDRIIELEKAQS